MPDMRSTDGDKKGLVRRVCAVCKGEFWGNPMQKYCSSECREKATKEMAREYYHSTKSRERVLKKCCICGKEFESSASRNAMYCSAACKDKAYKRRRNSGATEVIRGWVSNESEIDEGGSVVLLEEFAKGKV